MIKSIVIPLIVAVAGSFVTVYLVELKGLVKKEHWMMKRDLYLEAIDLVDKKIASSSLKQSEDSPDRPNTPNNFGPSRIEIRRIYNKLLLVTDNKEILRLFLENFGIKDGQLIRAGAFIPLKVKYDLVALMHKDLFGNKSIFTEKEAVFFSDQEVAK